MASSLQAHGAMTVAITNDGTSALAHVADVTLPIDAGREESVAATKTFVSSLVAGLWFIASLKQDGALLTALHALPEHLSKAIGCDWSHVAEALDSTSLLTLGRGPSSAISSEAALKFKETCCLHAESFSAAEVLHGPVSLVGEGFPIIAFSAHDAAQNSIARTADALSRMGAHVFTLSPSAQKAEVLPSVKTHHWLTDPIAAIVPLYGLVEEMAWKRGLNPDVPRHLNKVTETL